MPRPKTPLTAERLREVLSYNPETGIFLWRTTGKGRPLDLSRPAGNLRPDGYLAICLDLRLHLTHRLAWLHTHGEWPPNEIDHVNHDKSDNRIVNLRPATRTQNQQNRHTRKDAVGLKGTTRFRGRWKAQICLPGHKLKFLGMFDTTEEAHAAYMTAARAHFGAFANPGQKEPAL